MSGSTGAGRTGLCSNCNNRSYCVYRAGRGFDALYCEMFNGAAGSASVAESGERERLELAPRPDRMGIYESNVTGLCVNCADREKCILPRPEGGVWHCEEYK